jgi:hypothetical protein
VPPDIDEGLAAIRIAEVLNIPATQVRDLSPLWIRNALVRMKVDQVQQERAQKAAAKKRKTANARARSR